MSKKIAIIALIVVALVAVAGAATYIVRRQAGEEVKVFARDTFVPLGYVRGRAVDARIIASMNELRIIAELIYAKEGNYLAFNCERPEMKDLCEKIASHTQLVIRSSASRYCAYSKLYGLGYYFISNKESYKVTENPEITLCKENEFPYSKIMGKLPEVSEEKLVKRKFLNLLKIIFSIVFSFAGLTGAFILSRWRKNLLKRKLKPPAIHTSIRAELKAHRSFYTWVGLFFGVIILYPLLIFLLSFLDKFLEVETIDYLFWLILLLPSLGLATQILFIKRKWNAPEGIVSFEAYLSLITLSLFWIFSFFSGWIKMEFYHFSFSPLFSILSFAVFPFLFFFCLGCGIMAALKRGILNKVFGLATILVCLLLGFLTFGVFFIKPA